MPDENLYAFSLMPNVVAPLTQLRKLLTFVPKGLGFDGATHYINV